MSPPARTLRFELHFASEVSLGRRHEILRAVVAKLPSGATHPLVELGGDDPDVAELRVIPVGDDVEARVAAAIVGVPEVTLRDRSDHIVGLNGPDLEELQTEADKLAATLTTNNRLHVVQTIGGTSPAPNIKIDRDTAARLGVRASDIDTTLYAASGMTVNTLWTQRGSLPVVVSLGDPGHLEDTLQMTYIRTASGPDVPLSSLTMVEQQVQPTEVLHEGQFPWLGIRVSGPLDELQTALAKLPVPHQIRRDVRAVD